MGSEQTKDDRLTAFFTSICLGFVQGIKALSLYPQDHPETEKKIGGFFKILSKYLKQRPNLTILFTGGEVVVENRPLPELSGSLSRFIKQLETMNCQRVLFNRGIDADELGRFFEFFLSLLKTPDKAENALENNKDNFPHITAGKLPVDGDEQVSHEEFIGVFRSAQKSVLSFSQQLKDLFAHLDEPIPESKVAEAKETTRSIYDMNLSGEIPLKVLIFRRNKTPNPYLHAINVSALSMALGSAIQLEDSLIKEIGLGALLHDVGLHVPSSADLSGEAGKPLTEEERRKEHPIRGAEILLASGGIPDLVPLVAYEHHIQYDGKGYPEQKTHRDLNLASMITFICNSYDNLRRERPGEKLLSLTDSLNWMDQRMGTSFHPMLYKKFRAMVKAQVNETV